MHNIELFYARQNKAPRLPDMVPNPNSKPAQLPAPPKKVARKKRRKRKKTATRSSPQPVARGGQQPRDNRGRFAKVGAFIWGFAKGTANVVSKTVKTAKKAHRTLKRVNAVARRRQRLEERERDVAIREREQRLGARKVMRRKRR